MHRQTFHIPAFLLLILCLSLLAGCHSILERSFSYEQEHSSADDGSESEADIPELSSYGELEDALQDLIERHIFAQTVRLVDYSGEVERDVQRAVYTVMATPLGDFAVNNIAYQNSRILSYYEIRFDVTYRRTEQELEELQFIESPAALETFLTEKMAQFPSVILFRVSDYNPSVYDFDQLYQRIYYSNPQLAYGYRALEHHLYPDTGSERIVEMNISYAQPIATLQAKSSTATEEAQIILDAYIGSGVTANRVKYIHDTLCATADFDTETAQKILESERPLAKSDPFTVYGAIIKGRAVSEGIALAFKQLCDMNGIPCQVISGKRDGVSHMWNLVQSRGEWTHIDCAADNTEEEEPVYTWFGRSDEEMAERYTWDAHLYPAAGTAGLREILALNEESEEDTVPAVPQEVQTPAEEAEEETPAPEEEPAEEPSPETEEPSPEPGKDENETENP